MCEHCIQTSPANFSPRPFAVFSDSCSPWLLSLSCNTLALCHVFFLTLTDFSGWIQDWHWTRPFKQSWMALFPRHRHLKLGWTIFLVIFLVSHDFSDSLTSQCLQSWLYGLTAWNLTIPDHFWKQEKSSKKLYHVWLSRTVVLTLSLSLTSAKCYLTWNTLKKVYLPLKYR